MGHRMASCRLKWVKVRPRPQGIEDEHVQIVQ
jgi:hypothetical protein